MSKKFNIHDWHAKRRQQFLTEEVALDDYSLEPEGMDDPDEDLVIIGSGYLDIKSNFKERPPQTNGEYAEIGQKVVDQLHNGDKEAALNFIYSKINETDDRPHNWKELPGYNPDAFYGDDSIMGKLKKDPDYIKKLNAKNTKKEHHNDEDFPGKDLSAWDLLDKIKAGNEDLYNKVEDFMKSMKEMSMTSGEASFDAGNSMAHLGKKKKRK